MAGIYSGVLQGMMDAFGSIVSNNLNNVMKIFSILSIVLNIPTIIFSAYGMNLNLHGMPLSGSVWGFAIVWGIAVILSALAWIYFRKARLFR